MRSVRPIRSLPSAETICYNQAVYTHHPHDAFFREVFSRPDIVRSWIKQYLPPHIVERIDLGRLILEKESFIGEELRETQADVVYKAYWKTDANPLYFYLLFEHKSSPSHEVAYQLLGYKLQLWRKNRPSEGWHPQKRPLPFIFPIVFYHGPRPWRIPVHFSDLFGELPNALKPFVPEFRYLLQDFSHHAPAPSDGDPILELFLLSLRAVYDPNLPAHWDDYVEKMVEEYHHNQESVVLIKQMLSYLLTNTETVDLEQVQASLAAHAPQGEQLLMTVAQQWMLLGEQRGKQEGIKEGKKEGKKEGQIAMLLRLIQQKFGPPPSDLVAAIHQLANDNDAELDEVVARLLMANSLEELGLSL